MDPDLFKKLGGRANSLDIRDIETRLPDNVKRNRRKLVVEET